MFIPIVDQATTYDVAQLAASTSQEVELVGLLDVSAFSTGLFVLRVHGNNLDAQVSAIIRAYAIWPTANRGEYLTFEEASALIDSDSITSGTAVGLYLDSSVTGLRAPFARFVVRFSCGGTAATGVGDLTLSVGMLAYPL